MWRPRSADRGLSGPDSAEHSVPVYERLDLPEGAEIVGPAILEQDDATIFIDPGLIGRVDRYGNVILTREAP